MADQKVQIFHPFHTNRCPMVRTIALAFTGLLLATTFSVPFWNPASSAPLPKDLPKLGIKLAGTITIPDLAIGDAAIIDESKVVVVGTVGEKDGVENPDERDPNGAIIDLGKKAHRPFTNGHTARIGSVSAVGNRIATTSNNRDPNLRVWDLKAGKSVAEIKIGQPGASISTRFGAACFHKDDRIAIAADGKVIVLDPAKPDDRTEYDYPDGEECWSNEKPVVSHDDEMIANSMGLGQIAYWNVATKKPKALNLLTERDAKEEDWLSGEVLFGRKGTVLAWRCASRSEVPENTPEADVPAERRGVMRIDLAKGKMIPLKMGQTIHTFTCAIDPTET